jgi:hypothetical protein
MLKGTLLAESLRPGAELDVTGLRLTQLGRHDVSRTIGAGQPPVWTFVGFEADDGAAEALAQSLSGALLAEGGWYADFVVGNEHVVVFAGRIFRYRRGSLAGRAEAEDYGRTVGVPDNQLDWPE